MDTFIIDTKTITLLLATLFTGLLAGVFFTWSNAVVPGIGRLDDMGYLKAFQNMNRSILNPFFYLIFIGPLLFAGISAYFNQSNSVVFRLIICAGIIYFTGVFLLTILGNIPLNEMLDKADLSNITSEDAAFLRSKFEAKWNNFHLIRTIASVVSFIVLIISCFLKV